MFFFLLPSFSFTEFMFVSSCSNCWSIYGTFSLFDLFCLGSRSLCCLLSSVFSCLFSSFLNHSLPVVQSHGHYVVCGHITLAGRVRLTSGPLCTLLCWDSCDFPSKPLFFFEAIWFLRLRPALVSHAVLQLFIPLFKSLCLSLATRS